MKITIKNSKIPEINVLVGTNQSEEKLNFLKRISPEIPETAHKLEARLANVIPRNFILVSILIFPFKYITILFINYIIV
ncbi:MAG: hypothetical protein ACFNJI_07735 [Leptotrichia hongkongensis]